MSKFIHVRHGGIVAVAQGPAAAEGDRPRTALHVHGCQTPQDRADAEVQLAPDEVAHLVSELVERLPAGDRQTLVAKLSAS
jgi:hypothetical protein